MSARNFNTQNSTFRQLLGNGLTYRVPRFQRDYSWGEDEWEDLWIDIKDTIRDGGEPAHYMGYLVLQSPDEKTFDVIDGQQRITTLSMLVIAVLKNLQRLVDGGNEPADNARRLEQIRQTYIGYLDPVTLVPRSKLSLNRNNDPYYQNYIVPMVEQLPLYGFKASEHQLRKAFEWFDRHVRDYLKSFASGEGKAAASLVETMSDRLFFTVINVTDELNAYKVFETLNARGVRLSATDLLKNYLFSVLDRAGRHETEFSTLEARWEAIVGRLGSESFPNFLRVHWNSRNAPVRQADLFKAISNRVKTHGDVFGLLRGMDEDLDTYLALVNPEGIGNNWSPEARLLARALRTFGVRQPLPVLLSARRAFTNGDFETLLRACVVISFRYNVIAGLGVSDQEKVYGQTAVAISTGSITNAAQSVAALAPIYLPDATFTTAFETKSIQTTDSRNRRVVRYILCAIEKQASGQDLDYTADSLTIEHILPQNPGGAWAHIEPMEFESLVYRLGNMTLLGAVQNREAGSESFPEKLQTYAASPFQITSGIRGDGAEWNGEAILRRQRWMAKAATSIWRIPQLD